MDGSSPIHPPSEEEKMGLLDERSLSSDSESDPGILDLDQRLSTGKWLVYLLSPLSVLRSFNWRTFIVRLAWFFVPSFLQGRYMREQIRPAKLYPTAYLDGMRGLAALFVFFCHYTYQGFRIAFSWGANNDHYDILKLPIIRLWYSGPAAVSVFFVISGYALSYRPLKLIRNRNTKDFSTAMSSMVFRRFLRLFGPTTASTFLIVILLRIGAYESTREFSGDRTFMRNVVEPHADRISDAWEQWKHWAWCTYNMVHVFGWEEQGGRNPYDVHLWTIPMEYRCSLYLFLVIVGTARLRTFWRYMTLLTVLLFSYRHSRWEFTMFLFGMGLAEWDHIRGAHVPGPALPTSDKPDASSRHPIKNMFFNFVAFVGLYLLSFPDDGWGTSPGWMWLGSMIPEWWATDKFRFWQGIGAVVFIIGVARSAFWLRFFNSAVVQYFGKISYALYLMHGPAMHVIGYHWEKLAWSITGVEGNAYTVGWVLGAIFCVPSVIWCADIFWRAVDIPTVKLGKWMEDKLIAKDD